MSKRRTQIWSIYGQIDEIVARAMVKERKFNQVPKEGIPESQLFDGDGNPLKLAVVVPTQYVAEYEERVAILRM